MSSLGFFAQLQLWEVSLSSYNNAAFFGLVLELQLGLSVGSSMLVLALQARVAWHPMSAVESCGDVL